MREPDVVNMLFGSHLYGLDTPESDMDYKGIYLPTKEELLLGNYAKTYNHSTGNKDSKNGNEDVDTEVIALPYFIKQACQGETFALDMLHCNNPISSSPIWEDLVSQRKKFYSKDMKAYVGYVKKQAAKYGLKGSRLACIKKAIESLQPFRVNGVDGVTVGDITGHLYTGEYANLVMYTGKGAGAVEQEFYEVNGKKYQTTNSVSYVVEQLTKMYDSYGARAKQAESNDGVDWKAISHAIRAGVQARDIYMYGDFEYPLTATEDILKVKLGQMDYKTEAAPMLESIVDSVEAWSSLSHLPAKVDTKYWDQWLLDVYEEYVL